MNQYFYDEIKCIQTALTVKKMHPKFYCGNEINIIADENGLAAYLAGYYMSVCEQKDKGVVNVILEGECRNKKLYDEIAAEFSRNSEFNIYSDYDEYVKNTHHKGIKRFYYFANLQLDEYKDDSFVSQKKENLEKWTDYSVKNDGRFMLIPIFNFEKPFPQGVAACSERELEAIALYDSDFRQAAISGELEEICRKKFHSSKQFMKVVRFDNIFGPLVQSTSKLGLDEIIDELLEENKITFRRSDNQVHFTGCYIRQAVTAIHYVDLMGNTGNIYNASNYRFTLYDIKNMLYKSFDYKKPEICFVDDLEQNEACEKYYECLGNIKIKNLGWAQVTPLQEAIYRTALAKASDEYIGDFYVSIYQGKLERIKKIEMDIMREIDRICKENNITYFLVGGTLLGAVRHKGFIPWDDDIDIGMLREDYDKFREVCPSALKEHLSYQSYKQEPSSHYIFDKVRLKDTYFNTKFSNRFDDIQNGIFIDVLVFDKTSNSAFGQRAHIKLIKIFKRLINVRWVNIARVGIHYRASKLFLPLMRKVPYGLYHFCFEKVLQLFKKKKNSEYIIDGVGLNLEKGAFPLSWFNETIEVPYEDMTFKIPVGYDGYLRKWYGDRYMELLPLSSRNSGHKLLRLDLGKYLFAETENMKAHENNLLGELYEEPVSE
ncbi:MAG: LicD family protein [Clostridia bacterium]|nr:LicD family protein [Clostridia bacterium]